jgi:putative hydrolase of the HAD superfamily
MSAHHIKAIFFDAAGTLFTVNGSVGEIYARLARDHGKEVSVLDLEAGFRRAFAAAPPMAFPDAAPGQIPTLERQWWRNLVHAVFSSLGPFPRFDEYFAALFSFFARAEAWRLYPETLATLEGLKRRGFTLGVISNFDSRLFGLLDGLGVSPFVDPVVISTQVGAAKPAGDIFTRALAHVGIPAEAALHVGDSYEADVVGAQAAGITPVFVDRRGHGQETANYFQVSNLTSLLELMERR